MGAAHCFMLAGLFILFCSLHLAVEFLSKFLLDLLVNSMWMRRAMRQPS